MRILRGLLLLILLNLNAYHVQAIGRLPYKNFSHRDYLGHFQNWAIIQDQRGLIYAANNNGILEFDGTAWRSISVKGVVARCLDTDSKGRVWVGGQDEIGFLTPDSLGYMVYKSLMDLVPKTSVKVGLVRQVFATNHGIYFSSNSCIIRLYKDEYSVFYPKTLFHRTYFVNGKIYSLQPQVGLTVLANDTLTLAPSGAHFENTRIYSMLPYDKDRLLIATQSDGFWLYGLTNNESENTVAVTIKPFKTSNDNFFKQNWVYNGITLPNGNFAFGTYRGGVAIIDSNGDIVQYIGKSQGIQDETVWHLTCDSQDNIWLALNNGISYSALNSPLTSFDEDFGVQGVLQTVYRHGSILYISSNAGVFALDKGLFKRVNGILNLSWDMLGVKTSDKKNHLLVATGDGVYSVNGFNASKIRGDAEPTFAILKLKQYADILLLGLYDGIGLAKYKDGVWQYLGKFANIDGYIEDIVEDSKGYIWFVNRYRGIIRAKLQNPSSLVFDEIKEFVDIENCSSFNEDCKLLFVNDQLMLSCSNGLSYFDYKSNTFKPNYSLGTEFGDGSKGIKIHNFDENGYLWFESYTDKNARTIERAFLNEQGKFIRTPTEFNEIPRMVFYDVFAEKDGVTWIAGADGLYRFDSSIKNKSIKIPNLLIREVFINDGTPLFGGTYINNYSNKDYFLRNFQESRNIPEIPHSQNSLTFRFSTTLFGQEERMVYSHMLEGFEEVWSGWNSNQEKDYTNLPFGRYTFKVKALSVFNVESNVAAYSFVIARPWYWHPIAYFAYSILAILIVILFVKIKTKMLIQSNLKLQELVGKRTKEILQQKKDIQAKSEELIQQKEEIEAQRDELEYRNKQTSASIQYAHTIQQAILPDNKSIDEHFEYFILYKPKDVVSGDFYWFSQLQKAGKKGVKRFILAVVDCTGHGVPGAFMSMIGSRMLSEIINERKIHSPAKILTELDKMLKTVLHQDSGENFDGMDVSICMIDQTDEGNYLVNFAGANRHLLFHSNSEGSIDLIRGNRKSIGGVLPDIDPHYVNRLLHLQSGDSIFLYTDGITDQNNSIGKKFSSKRLTANIQNNISSPMPVIGEKLEIALNRFMGNVMQRDDITVVGLRVK
ncbi:MAG: SpoIIE family protein phosphatase [Tenuifilaceae bacterium]|nr:SpoIIE family protein phosphatase [Tenuifilaceae bacterium]